MQYLQFLKKKWKQTKIRTQPALLHNTVKKTDFIIWGCNAFSEYFCHVLDKDSRANIIAFIETNKNAEEFCGRKIYTPAEFKEKNWENIPIIVAVPHGLVNEKPAVEFETIYQFKLKIQEIIYEHGISNYLLHPCALIDFVPVTFPNRIIQFGLPGSGITFLSHICAKIVERNSHAFETLHPFSKLFEALCFEYIHCIRNIIADTAHSADGFNFHLSSWKIATTYAIFTSNKIRMEIYSLSTRNHVMEPVCNYHQIPDTEYLEKLKKQDFKLFFNMRDPLDIILSCMNKVYGIHPNSSAIDMKIFCRMSRYIIEQLNFWGSAPFTFNQFNYEKFMRDPLTEIQYVMNALGVAPDSDTARKIWDELSFKQLNAAPRSHFWKGGEGKWKKYFTGQHISFLKSFGMEEVLERYGYQETLQEIKNHSGEDSLWRSSCDEKLLQELECPVPKYEYEHTDTGKILKNYYGEANYAAGDYFYIAGNDTEEINKMKNLFENRFIKTLVLSGAHPEFRLI